MEEFIPIPEYPQYLISRDGRLYSTKTNKLLTLFLNNRNYPYYSLCIDGKTKNLLVSRILAYVFKDLPSLDSDLEVDHNDGNTLNFELSNLIVRTSQEHMAKTLEQRGLSKARESFCAICSKKLDITNSSGLCNTHYQENLRNTGVKNPEITSEQIEYWVKNFSWVRAAKELGYSDNGLRKRYKSLTGKDPKSIKGC
ncbi:homing endonuclease [Salmonella phage vB_StyS-LmqsSP1]|uniref:Homing endonuclease n=1 Tax=Salmonella phage vB_StyS-LmqsSP1 TaxID=2749424 RepID=A0AAE7P6R9_9CAUD|nr:homing endonuclease [Salmonella phage vB_StyS-LmqsSP1]